MTTETKFVVLFRKWCIKYRWIIFCQEFEILASVGDMASAAIIVVDRAVKEFLVFDLVCESRQNFTFGYFLWFIMTGHANLGWLAFQYEFNSRGMWSMTMQAAIEIGDHAMLVHGIFSNFLYVFMTCVAKVWCEVFDHF